MKIDSQACGFATRAVHVGHDPSDRPEDRTGSVTAPIYQTSTYVQESVGGTPDYEYARVQNPTRSALEKSVASLEGGRSGHAYASGMAAISAIMTVLDPGDQVIVSRDVYGGTNRYFNQVLARYGLGFHWVDTTDPDAVQAAIRDHPPVRMIYIETPSNPTMAVTDLAAMATMARQAQALLVVDNTFMSPYLQRPLELGADIVVHSTTKFMNGHSDSLGGVVITASKVDAGIVGGALRNVQEDDLAEHFAYMQKCAGGVLAPFECFLVLRGLRTLAVRMDRHEENGRRLAAFLDAKRRRGQLERLLYPGLEDHPEHAIQSRQADGFGAMIGFDLGSLEAATKFLEALTVFSLAESLGGVESLACHPVTMTHASVSEEDRAVLGITGGLVRLSVGIECYEDLEADVARGLAAVG